jgi:4-hydroxy-3-polyprenylbenzoate decarboxylase
LVIGDDPALLLTCASGISLNYVPGLAELDKLTLAGYLRRARFEVASGHSVGLEVPANAEFILEGFIEPGGESGLVAQSSGYYGTVAAAPVFTLSALTHRKRPVYTDIVPGLPPQEEAYIAKVRERLLLPLLQFVAPEVCDINLMPGYSSNNMLLVSIKKSYPGQAQKVMFALWGMAILQEIKYLVVLDADCNLQDLRESLWQASWHINPERDFTLVKGTLSPLELNNPTPGFGGKLGIDATRKLSGELHPQTWPQKSTISEQVLRLVEEKWSSYGID